MYEGLDFLGATKELADRVILHDRHKYRPYYKIILAFLRREVAVGKEATAYDLFVGGVHACAAFESREFRLEELVVEAATPILIYCQDPKRAGIDLMAAINQCRDEVFPDLNELHLFSRDPGAEYQMNTTIRRFCTFKRLGIYRDTPLTSLMRPPIISGIKCVSPEIMLIDIYRRIFLAPDDEDDDVNNRANLLRLESRLFDRLYGERRKIVGSLDGTAESPETLLGLRKVMLQAFSDHIVVGRQACKPNKDLDDLQIVVGLPNNDINHALQAAVAEWRTATGSKAEVEVKRYFLSLPVDTRLIRFRVTGAKFDSSGSPVTRVIDVFNAGNYDLIARNHPFTIFRFLLVDVWTNNLIRKIMSGNQGVEAAIKRNIEQMIDWMHERRGQVRAANNKLFNSQANSVAELSPLFLGTSLNEAVANRQERRGALKSEIIWARAIADRHKETEEVNTKTAAVGKDERWELGGIPDVGVMGFLGALMGVKGPTSRSLEYYGAPSPIGFSEAEFEV